MSAYIIAHISVNDATQYSRYTALTPDIIAKYGGKFIVRGGEATTLEGAPETRRVVVIEFPDAATAQQFFDSEAYQAAKKLREGAATGSFVLVDGV